MARETTISPSAARVSVLNSESGAIDVTRLRAEGTALLTQSLMLLTPEQRAALAAALPALEQLADPDPRGPARPLEQQGG